MQKFKPVLIIAVVLVLGAALYFFFIRTANVYETIPKSAVAVIEVNNWNQFADKLNTTSTGIEFKKTDAAQKLLNEITLMQELLGSDKSLKETNGSAKTVASVHLISADDYDFLFTLELSGVNDNTILNRIESSSQMRSVNVRILKNQNIIDVILKDGKQLSIAKLKNILAFSFTSFLTENAMTAYNTGNNLNGDKNFKSVLRTLSAAADLNLYFNFQKADVIFPVAIKTEKNPLLNELSATGSWGKYEVRFSNDKMELDGDISTNKEVAAPTGNILNDNLLSEIPDHAAYVQLNRTDTTGNELLKNYFRNWMGSTKAFAILEPLKEDFTEQNILLIAVKDKYKATNDLKRLIAFEGANPIPSDTFLNSEIYHLQDGAVLNQLFENSLIAFNSPYFTIKEGAVIFCNNSDVLKLLLEKISKGETLDKDKSFLNTDISRFGMNSGIQYMNFQRSDLLIKGIVKENSSLTAFIASFKNVLAVSNTTGKKISSHIVFNTSGESKTTSGLLWKTKLKTASTYIPQIVLNSNTNEKEIFVQDTDNNIYLISKSGEILFTKNTGEPILGSVTQLDYYKNNKLQYIFNSAHHIFIVDRLGNDVASYPLRLSATAACGMTLTKDASSGIYRYYIPCNNGTIYGYESNGKPLAGWSPRIGVGVISKPLQFYSNKKNDFVLAFNNSGKLMLLDAKGNLKWAVDNLPITKQNFSLVETKDNFTTLNASANQLTEISADGNDNIKPLIDTASSFAALTTSDSTYNYYFCSSNQIRAYNNKDEFQTATTINVTNISSLEILNISGKNYLLATDESSKQFFVYDTSLKTIVSFGYGNANSFAVSDLLNQNELSAITCDSSGNVSCFRIK